MSVKVMIVDDHTIVRQGLSMLLTVDPELEVVGEAANGAQALELVQELQPDVILMDLLMPVMDGITAIKRLRQDFPDIEILALTSVLEDASVVEAVRAGAIGYLLKGSEAQELRAAIKAAAAGQVQLSPQALARLMQEMREPVPANKEFTKRELEVLSLVAQGKANKEIAEQLQVVEKTVKTHVSNILDKLGVQSRTQAALAAVQLGLVPPSGVAKSRF
jgi:NarL family two-component system response regulator LiaR